MTDWLRKLEVKWHPKTGKGVSPIATRDVNRLIVEVKNLRRTTRIRSVIFFIVMAWLLLLLSSGCRAAVVSEDQWVAAKWGGMRVAYEDFASSDVNGDDALQEPEAWLYARKILEAARKNLMEEE